MKPNKVFHADELSKNSMRNHVMVAVKVGDVIADVTVTRQGHHIDGPKHT